MKDNTEQDWVQRAKQGETAAIAELFRRYWRAARAAAYGVTGDFALAEDTASEAFYAAIESLPDLRDVQRFGPWLRTIVVRTARRQKAKTSKENGAELQTLPDDGASPPGAHLERQELAALIHEAVGHLSENLREAVVLFYFEGYSLKEAAHFLDVPEGTLKRRLHDGRQRLRDAAEQILKGAKPMNAKREQILQQLKDASEEGIQSEAFFQAVRQALSLRPASNDLLRKIMQSKDTRGGMLSQMKQGGRLSDSMSLLWKRTEPLELRAVEELLRRLSNEIVPNTPVSFCPYEEPRYRAGLRMQLGDDPVPAAIGGVQNPWPGLPDGINVASVVIYLEPWAAAQTGEAVELANFSLSDFMKKGGQW